MSEPTYISIPDVFMTSDASLTLQQHAVPSLDERIMPAYHVAYDVESYYVAYGQAVADSALGIDCTVEVEMGALAAEGGYEAAWAPEVSAALAPQSRWLPLDGTFDTGTTWEAYAGDERLGLSTEGTDTYLDTAFPYVRGQRFINGAAMRLDDGDYFFTDGARWASESVACAMVVVLRTPMLDSYGLLETYSVDGSNPDSAYVGLRYTSDGEVEVHSRGRQGIIQTASQGSARTGQPIIVAFALTQPQNLDVIVVDRKVTRMEPTINLGAPHPYDARLYVGRDPDKSMGSASMDILELDYWTGLTADQLLDKVHILDRLYGVTT